MSPDEHRQQAEAWRTAADQTSTTDPDGARMKGLLIRLAQTHEALAGMPQRGTGIPCAGTCGRPLRPKGAYAENYPGTLATMAKGMCNYCYAREPKVFNRDGATECHDCKRPFRPHHTRVADYPDTVSKHLEGRCKSCYNAHHGVTKKQLNRRPDNCLHCERPLRPKLRSIHEFPGTVEHAGRGLCTTCKSDARKGIAPQPRDLPVRVSTPTPRVEFQEVTDPGLLRMRQAREARAEAQRRQEQFHRVRVAQEAARARFLQSRRAA